MKTAAQVFIILSMVCGFWMILPLIFGGIALSQMSKGQRPSTGISVCVLLFCSFVGGILLLCAKDEDFYKPGTNYGYNPNMNNGYNPNMNNGYNPNMNNGYNANMNNNALITPTQTQATATQITLRPLTTLLQTPQTTTSTITVFSSKTKDK